ncbi:DDE-type integrase/transposase/recombinase [Halopseudomonas phragmitis]|nr:DDE-type integrase/transposase/recombinase [Halopseudomonas phragmitis]
MTERLVAVAQAIRAAGHGGKQAIYEQACSDLGISLATLHRKLRNMTVKKQRKVRADAGKSDLTYDEALLIVGSIKETTRGNDKINWALMDAVTALRANGLVRAERVDPRTGEITPLSESAIRRAIRGYGLHIDQLTAPTPHVEMRSEHPNHVWQIDASLCVLYYLKPSAKAQGLHIMDQDKFYKNKPANVARVMADRVWSYEITDHASGWIYVEYVMGAESGENLCSVLINALQERGGPDMLHGVPRILYMDPGSANTSAMTLNLCKSLGIEAIAHAPGSARATGQVENARNIIERKFEAGLRYRPVADLAELNALAAQWRAVFNATGVHRRHGMTRTAAWMRITEQQLVKAPSIEVCRELAIAEPVERKVKPGMRISFQGAEYSVKDIPNVMVHEKVLVTRNPWRSDAAQVVATNATGHQVIYVIPRIEKGEFGFSEGEHSVPFGDFARHADTPAQKASKAIEQLMTGTTSTEDAAAERKAKALPLAGKLDPYKPLADVELPTYMPRRGTDHKLTGPVVELPPLSHVAAAKRLKAMLGDKWTADAMATLKETYKDGVPEPELEAFAERIRNPKPQRPGLRLVGGDAC